MLSYHGLCCVYKSNTSQEPPISNYSYIIDQNGNKCVFTPSDTNYYIHSNANWNIEVLGTTLNSSNIKGIVFGKDFLSMTTAENDFLYCHFYENENTSLEVDLRGLKNITSVGEFFCGEMFYY
jgi:hypothetical protein